MHSCGGLGGKQLLGLLADCNVQLGGRVVLASKAWKSAKKYPWGVGPKVEGAMKAMADVLWGLYFDPTQKSGNIEAEFRARSGYRVALRECRLTNRSLRMRRARLVEFGGSVLDAVSHVKVFENGKQFRIYYAVDRVAARLVIACCGPHLETAGTRYCR